MLQRLIKLFLTTSVILFGYPDSDLDGVDDNIDLCPNTPFDELVDKKGCASDKLFPGKLTLQIGNDISFNQVDDTTNNITIYANYMLEKWNFSIANSSYYINNLSNDNDITGNNLYLTTGYTFLQENMRTLVSVGTKFDISDWEKRKQERNNDYYASLNVEYLFQQKHNLSFYYSYTISGDSHVINYENFHSLSAGYGYSVTDKWYTSLSYNFTQNSYPNTNDYQAISWYNTYRVNKYFYTSLNYAHALDDISYSHIVTFSIGVDFD